MLGIDASAVADEIVRHLSALVRLDTSNPPGNEALVARYLAGEFVRLGIEHRVLESAPGRANFVARLAGSGSEPPLMLLAHADVVGASPEGWRHPPFSGAVVDGEVWGRGTLDMKGHIASGLVLMEILAERRVPLRGDVLLVVTADEEAGSHLGAHWLWENHRALVEADIAFNEGGGQRFTTPGGPRYTVQVAEKGAARLRLTATGTAGHASIPRADNAVFALAAALTRLSETVAPTVVTPASARMLDVLADSYDGAVREEISAFLAEPTWEAARRLPLAPALRDYVQAGLHNTAVPTMLAASDRINVAPGTASALLDGRLVPGQRPEHWAAHVQAIVGDRARVELVVGRESTAAHDGGEVMTTIDDVLDELDPGARALPYISSASSDARALPGVRVFGFFPSRSDVDMMRLIHGVDERARISDLTFAHRCLAEIVLRLRA